VNPSGMGRSCDSRWDALVGINPAAWWASLKRTPQLLRQRAFHTRTLAETLEVRRTAAVALAAPCNAGSGTEHRYQALTVVLRFSSLAHAGEEPGERRRRHAAQAQLVRPHLHRHW